VAGPCGAAAAGAAQQPAASSGAGISLQTTFFPFAGFPDKAALGTYTAKRGGLSQEPV
jgi:hypothetical protein